MEREDLKKRWSQWRPRRAWDKGEKRRRHNWPDQHQKHQMRQRIWVNVQQKVYVQGGKEEEPLELEVYNQGMFKTEFCNKWQETGACPYGHHCQFAHGIEELRLLICHPHYKTKVCRMVVSGDVCPYGYRATFAMHLMNMRSSWATSSPGPGKTRLGDHHIGLVDVEIDFHNIEPQIC
ncbi:hypothetical protein REPUB_Repub03eG0020200 [Reevesia pubescens]